MKKYYSLFSYFRYLRQYRWRMLLIFSMFVVANALITIIPVFIGRLIGAISVENPDTGTVWMYVWFLIACSTLHDVVWRLSEIVYMKAMLPAVFRYEVEIFRHVIDKPYPYFVGKFTGKVASYVTLLGRELKDFVERIFYNYATQVVRLVSLGLILFSVNTFTGILFVSSMLLMYVVGRYTVRNNVRYEADFTDVESDKNGKIIDIMANFVNLKSFQKEQTEHVFVQREQDRVIKAATKSFTWALVFWGSMGVIIRNVLWPATIASNVWFYLQGSISTAELATLLSAIALFSDYVWEGIWNISQLTLKLARIEEAYVYLFGKNVLGPLPDPTTKQAVSSTFERELQLHNISFAYPDQPDQRVIDGLSLTIKKGEKIGIVGKSGSGKTTFVKLLLGYYELNDGELSLDGQILSSDQLLEHISYVPQDTTLFNRTIAENIAYASTKKESREQIIHVARRALADEFIQKIPDSYDAVVGERGVKLSTGQRQRIAIARAMIQDRPLLILDEATSALDTENELLVQKSLENLWADRTVISIAHRLSTLRKMDRIVVFDDGKIVESGTIAELLSAKGVFYDLWNHQVNGMLVE